ncbi:MAG: hypothetical protein U0324_15070 [Polyangiales bacterium]
MRTSPSSLLFRAFSGHFLFVLAAMGGAACEGTSVVSPAPDAGNADVASPDVASPDVASPDVATDAPAPTDVVAPGDAPPPVDAGAMDWGFRPGTDGFNFANRGTSRPGAEPMTARLDANSMRRMFGPSVCVGANATGPCVLVPNAAQWLEKENDGASAGNCEGYSILAAHMYAGAISPMTYGGANAFALPLAQPLEQEIMFWALSQTSVSQMVAPTQRKTPRELVDFLTAEFARGRAFGGVSLGVSGAEGGHSILPYALRRRSATVVEVLVYDNNHPGTERFVTLDTAANTWSYAAALNASMPDSLWSGSDTVRPLTVQAAAPRLALPHPSDAWQNAPMDGGGANRVRINTVGDARISVTDAMMRTTAFGADGRYQEAIPGSRVSLRMPGALRQPDPLFEVPRATALTVTLDGAGLSAASPSEVLFQGTGWTLGLEGVSIDPGQRDTLVIQPGAPDLLYRASGVETPTLTLAFQSAGDDYLIEVRSGAMTAGQNLRLSVDFAMNRARVSFDGSTSAPTFELYVERVTASGTIVFDHRGVTATPTSAMFVNFGAWGGDTMPMSVGYDDNGDGTADRTATLTDEP